MSEKEEATTRKNTVESKIAKKEKELQKQKDGVNTSRQQLSTMETELGNLEVELALLDPKTSTNTVEAEISIEVELTMRVPVVLNDRNRESADETISLAEKIGEKLIRDILSESDATKDAEVRANFVEIDDFDV